MANYRSAEQLAKAQEERFRRVVRAADESTMKVAQMAKAHAIYLTTGTPLKRKKRGQVQFKKRGLPIGEQSGELSRSWGVRRARFGYFYLYNTARHAPFVLPLSGQRDRGFWREMGRRVRASARAIHEQGLRRALKG